jgi:hypothetical protein
MLAILATSYCLNKTLELVAFNGLEGVNYVFSHVSLILVATFLFSVFMKLLLTNYFAPFLAAQESDFLSRFFVPLALQASTLYMRPHISGTECVGFSKQDACGNLVVDSLPVIVPLSAFRRRFLVPTSVGLNANHTFLTH